MRCTENIGDRFLKTKDMKKVCVYCASSRKVSDVYFQAARQLGALLATANISIVYGGGSAGLMGALADSALSAGGTVTGIIPKFMVDLEWAHNGLTELIIVEKLNERRQRMIEDVDAVIALPGGCGTLEELIEAITWKRLGMYFNPIVIVNVNAYYEPFLKQLNRSVDENFMDARHRSMWTVADSSEQVIAAIENSKDWDSDARSFASI